MSGTRFYPNLRDATPDMDFSTPDMKATLRGPDCNVRWTAASTLSRCTGVWDCSLSGMHASHASVGVLSDSTPDLANCISTSLCSTKYCKRTAAISKSEFIRQPYGFFSETTSYEMALSNSTLHTKEFI